MQVFRDQDSLTATGGQTQKVAESILRFFPGFEAFTLPLPTANGEVMKSLNDNKHKLESQFLRKLEDFKGLLKSNLIPKHSCTDREFVTGEGRPFLTKIIQCSILLTSIFIVANLVQNKVSYFAFQ